MGKPGSAMKCVLAFMITLTALAPICPSDVSFPSRAVGSESGSNTGSGQNEQADKESSIFFSGFFDLGFASLKTARASQMRTSATGLTIGLGFGAVIIKYLDFAAGGGVVFLEDKDPFSQLTTAGEAESGVSVGFFYGQVGFQLPIPFRDKSGNFPVWVGSKIGIMATGASREINSCVDCYAEKLKFKGGAYLKPEIKLKIGRRVWIGFAYTFFSSKADFLNMIGLTLTGNFN